jgi:hypothetical protein
VIFGFDFYFPLGDSFQTEQPKCSKNREEEGKLTFAVSLVRLFPVGGLAQQKKKAL